MNDFSEINQVANYTLVEWGDNNDISDKAPSEYLPTYLKRFSDEERGQMYYWHALPEGWEQMEYPKFLEERRKRMAGVIRDAFNKLKGQGMTEVEQTRKCSKCGNEKESIYCKQCASDTPSDLSVSVSEEIKLRKALKGKIREEGTSKIKPHFEFSEKDVESGDSRLPEGVHISMSVDRKNDKYHQIVTDKRTGEALHTEDEPLSEHQSKKNLKKRK